MSAAKRGFSLVEVLVAIGILAMVMTAVAQTSGTSMENTAEVFSVTQASHLMEGIVLDLEEEYRTEGFPTNDLENRECELPREFDGTFECEYDLLGMDVGSDNLSSLGADANENVNASPLMQAFCTGGADGQQPVDPATALANLAGNAGQNVGALMAFQALLDPGFNQICGLNLDKMCQNTQMITSFIPVIIEQAAKSTRKLVVRLKWGEMNAYQTMRIETYITAIPGGDKEEGP